MNTQSAKKPPVAAMCVIGDEILSGKTLDTNTHYLAKSLFALGIDLRRVETIPDSSEDIISTVRRLSSSHDLVFTSGGIGPTHDDITYPSIAEAYGLPLELHQPTVDLMQESARRHNSSNWTMTEERKRMALFPRGEGVEILRSADQFWVPVVVVNRNIYILPGVPNLFRRLIDGLSEIFIRDQIADPSMAYTRLQIATSISEGDIAPALTRLQEAEDRISSGIKIGSYPKWNHDTIQVAVSVTGRGVERVKMVADEVKNAIQGWYWEPDPGDDEKVVNEAKNFKATVVNNESNKL